MKDLSMVLIDPQVGFCSPMGSLGSLYGKAELSEIEDVIPNIIKALDDSGRRNLVVSEYRTGQFTEGDHQHPLANLCVPGLSDDCDLIGAISPIQFHSSSIKHEQSALSSDKFASVVENDLQSGIRRFVLVGFLLEHCVQSTALDLFDFLLGKEAEVFVCSDLVASRSEKYANGVVSSSISNLQKRGIQIEPWNRIQS